MEERRKKGLCFNCDEKFQLGHHYKSAKILLLKGLYPFQGPISNVQLIELNDTDIPLSLEFDMLHSESVESKPKMVEVEITLYALLGSPSLGTMRIKGKINRHWVVILIDYFLDAAILSKLQLFLDPIVSFEVKVANGATIKTKDVCLDVKVVMQGHIFSVNLNALPLGDCELVLGIQWLRTLGLIQSDFLAMSMQFLHLGTTVTLFGMHPTNLTLQKGDHFFRKAVRKGILLQIMSLGLGTSSSQQQCDPLIEKLPIEFSLVFDTSSGLPPYRGYEHQILLNEGTALICQRPYRYPHFQKIEIEKIVTDLLEVGSIRPSQSLFSSPVLLVRKADGSWRMCIDYKALNQVAIKEKFPIPIVDELLDELAGSTIFSKLDLRSGYHQICMEEDIPKIAFRTYDGHYEFLVIAFGLTNAPSTFQPPMNDVFKPYLRRFVLVFFDDILVFSPTLELHLQHLKTVLELLLQHQLYAKRS